MKKILLIFCLLFFAVKGFSQQFSQYNTNTLFDSFENPSQKSFTTDSSKKFAFNFFIPNFDANVLLTGNAQATMISRLYGGHFNNAALQIGSGANMNYINANVSAYALMFKIFTSFNGDQEVGFFAETKAEGRGNFTDESIALFNGHTDFANDVYDNVLNSNYNYQVYDAFGFTYREKIDKHLAIGFKISALLGVNYNKLDVQESHLSFDNANDAETLSLKGNYRVSQGPGHVSTRDLLPTFRSPGASITFGTSYKTDDGIIIQANIKDLGFIHWYNNSGTYAFNTTATTQGVSGPKVQDSTFNLIQKVIKGSNGKLGSFTSPTDSRAELSVTKTYYLDLDKTFKYLPTLIGSKELLYNGAAAALVNRFQYGKYNVSLTASYDNLNLFNFGTQFMIQTPNAEFFIGSDRLINSGKAVLAGGNYGSYSNGSYTGADLFLGFSVKFGPVIEHPMNSSVIPMGEKGFFGRLYNRLFKTNE